MKMALIGLVLLIVGGGWYLYHSGNANNNKVVTSPSPTSSVVDYRASFKIYANGTMRIFTDPRYHNQSPDVYLEVTDPSIVHVKKRGITWGKFFDTLPSPMKVRKDCLTTGTNQLFCSGADGMLRFFLNEKETSDLLEKKIMQGDKALVTFGNDDTLIESQLQ